MLVLILLIIIMVTVVYLIIKKENNTTKNKTRGYNINESTFNPNYKISKDVNGLEIVQSCGN